MASLFSTLVGEDDKWNQPDPDYTAIDAVLGHAAATNRADAALALVNTAVHTPTVFLFQLTAEPTNIYVGHSPTFFSADLTNATPFDNNVMALIGDDIAHAVGSVTLN